MARTRIAPLILTTLVAVTAGASAAQGEDCLGGPNKPSPAGTHWFYRIDRGTHRKCWYLGDEKRHRAPATHSVRRRVAAPPDEPEEEAAAAPPAPPAPPRQAAPAPGSATRPPEAAAPPVLAEPGATIAAPRAEPERAPAAAMAERIGTRVVTTERVRTEPAPAKPQEPPKPQAAAPAPAATTPSDPADAGGGFPAALLGIALLLAAVGSMLVLARRRLTARDVYVTRDEYLTPRPDESATRQSRRARRSLSDILAQAEAGEPYDAATHETRFFDHIRRGRNETPAAIAEDEAYAPSPARARAETPDIATATLQPAIEALPPEPIAPAPDVEQSLRQLLDAWERLAA